MKSSSGKSNVGNDITKVFKREELTPYWESRLQRYEELGIVFTVSNGAINECLNLEVRYF